MNKSFIYAYVFFSTMASISSCDNKPKVYSPTYGEGYYILTPATEQSPRFNGSDVFGVRPNSTFFHKIAVTGQKPIVYSAVNLPKGLTLDANTGIISGKIEDKTPRTYQITLTAANSISETTRDFDIVVGKEICLTPPMGWSSWIATRKDVSQEKVLSYARKLKQLGLDEYGYAYINIDDAWQGLRGGEFNAIQPNPTTFPDIQLLSDQIHSMGMKFGIYSTPWISSYAKFIGGSSDNEEGRWDESMILDLKTARVEGSASLIGKYRFDENDAKQWAAWGVDYMKYDWNPNDSASTVNMAKALQNCGRDIVFSISNSCPMSEGIRCKEYVQVFRTNGDIRARWEGDGSHINLHDNWDHHNRWLKEGFEGAPGHIPDPDFLMVGLQKYGSKDSLTADQLYHHVSSYILWGSPLLLSCDLSKLSEFEINLLTNVEMLDINQDRLAKPAQLAYKQKGIEVLVKELNDGSKAFGIFNFNDTASVATIDWSTLGLEGEQALRDVWRQQNIGSYKDSFSASIRPHGVVVIRTQKQQYIPSQAMH